LGKSHVYSLTIASLFCAFAMTGNAEAKTCFRTECLKHAPFICKGPVGSCGFQQGRCIRTKRVRYSVPGRSCTVQPDLGVH
jgi:hypothetical protein